MDAQSFVTLGFRSLGEILRQASHEQFCHILIYDVSIWVMMYVFGSTA